MPDDTQIDEVELSERIDAARAKASQLMEESTDFRQAAATLVASRQLYAMAMHELERLIEAEPTLVEEERGFVEEVFIQTASQQAALGCDENTLLLGFNETVIPWMNRVASKHVAQDAKNKEDEAADWEMARRNRAVPIGIDYGSEMEGLLARDRPLVLVGQEAVVKRVIDVIVEKTLTARDSQVYYALRLMEEVPQGDKPPIYQLIRVGVRNWGNCARSNESWPNLFENLILPLMDAPTDLFVVDDLTKANPSKTGPVSLRARNPHKRFRSWAKKMGAAMVFGIPIPETDPPDLGTPEWTNLRTWATLRPVWLRDDDALHQSVMIGRDHVVEQRARGSLDGGKLIVKD